MTAYQPLHDRVLVQVDPDVQAEETKSQGGIILVQSGTAPAAYDVRGASVIAVGTGEILYNGEIRPLAVKIGDRVLVHINEVLPVAPSLDPTQPVLGMISERNLIAILSDERDPVTGNPLGTDTVMELPIGRVTLV